MISNVCGNWSISHMTIAPNAHLFEHCTRGGASVPLEQRERRRRREGKGERRRGRTRNEPPRCWGWLHHCTVHRQLLLMSIYLNTVQRQLLLMPIYLNTVRRVRNGYELQRVCIETVAALSTIDKLQTTRTFSTGRLVLLNCYSGVCMQTFFVVSES